MPDTSTIDLASVLRAGDMFRQQAQAGSEAVSAAYGTAQANADANAELYNTIGASGVIIDGAKQQSDLAVQNAKLKVANVFGTDINAQTEQLTGLARTVQEQYAIKDAALQKIQAKQSTSFFDDPLGYVINQFTVNDDIAVHNAADARGEAAAEQIQKINQLTQASNLTQTQIAQPITQASIAASASSIASAAQIKANEEKSKGVLYNVKGIENALSGASSIYQSTLSSFGAINQERNIQLAQQQLDRMKEADRDRKEAKETSDEYDDYILKAINVGSRNRLGPQAQQLDTTKAGAKLALALFKSGDPNMRQDYESGLASIAAGTKILSTSPASTYALLTNPATRVLLPPAADVVKNVLAQAAKDVSSSPTFDKKDKEGFVAGLNARTGQILAEQLQNTQKDPENNVFNFGSPTQIIAASPQLQALPVVQKVLAPLMQTGVDLSRPQLVFAQVAAAFAKGEITANEAAQTSLIFQVGVNTNLEARQLTALGVSPSQTYTTPGGKTVPVTRYSYNVPVPLSDTGIGFGDGKETVNFYDPVDFSRALNKYVAKNSNPFAYRPFY